MYVVDVELSTCQDIRASCLETKVEGEMNEYLEVFLRAELSDYHMDRLLDPKNIEKFKDRYLTREKLVKKYSWAVPTDEAIDVLVKLSPVIEIGAGNGYWASLVNKSGGYVQAFDKHIDLGKNHYFDKDSPVWFPVQQGDALEVYKYPEHTLFLCWPPMDEMASNALINYSGRYVVYVGESEGGCSARDVFFRVLDDIWTLERRIDIPQYWGIHDRMYVYTRKKGV